MRPERPLVAVELRKEQDVVHARQRTRQVAALLGFPNSEQTRLATAVSEIARNAWKYAGGGRLELTIEGGDPPALIARVKDHGPGIAELDAVLGGVYVSRTGMGLGISGSRRLVDRFDVSSAPGGTTVTLAKDLPGSVPPPGPAELAKIGEALARARAGDVVEELTSQNQELIAALGSLRDRERDLVALNRELEDTNRGVVALYAELDEKADYLRRASELKSRFLSNMSHEFRTPLNTVISFCRLLLDESDGPLNAEQVRQVEYAARAAEGMLELVNDLLDLAKVEAGKTTVRPAPFEVAELFGALRGMLRPLLATTQVALVLEDPVDLPTLVTDEGKVSQILRNFISNALKFTEKGEVRVSARAAGDRLVISVADTGIGIAPEDQELIFQEYAQIESHLQKRVKGTGLGLPLSRRLAELLGGRITIRSEPGVGSTFSLELPLAFQGASEISYVPEVTRLHDPSRFPVLIVEDNPETVFVYEKFLKGTPFQAIPASSVLEARRLIQRVRPVAVVLDVMLGHESTWGFLTELKTSPVTRGLPVLVATMVSNRHKARALGADDYAEKPVERGWLLERLEASVAGLPRDEVLVVDDEEGARYLLRTLLAETRYAVFEAASGEEGLRRARERTPAVVFLDLEMPDLRGEQVLARLKDDPLTRNVPVVIYTGQELDPARRAALDGAAAILSKNAPSRAAALDRIRDTLARVRVAGVEL